MEFLCALLDDKGQSLNDNIPNVTKSAPNETLMNKNNSTLTQNVTLLTSHLDPWDFHDWNKNVLIPLLCVIGIFGNLLNLAVLGKRIHEGWYKSLIFIWFLTRLPIKVFPI